MGQNGKRPKSNYSVNQRFSSLEKNTLTAIGGKCIQNLSSINKSLINRFIRFINYIKHSFNSSKEKIFTTLDKISIIKYD